MDGIHDLGGKPDYGPVDTRSTPSGFAQRWHASVFAMVNALFFNRIARNVDHFRHAIERIDPRSYLEDGYYGRWLGAVETLLVEAGKLDSAALTQRAMAAGFPVGARIAARPSEAAVDSVVEHHETFDQAGANLARPAKFYVGERVRTVATAVSGHTRLPAYARGKIGEVIAQHGGWVYPDTHAHGRGPQPQYLYTVAFDQTALWGTSVEAEVEVCLDLFEPYLESLVEGAA